MQPLAEKWLLFGIDFAAFAFYVLFAAPPHVFVDNDAPCRRGPVKVDGAAWRVFHLLEELLCA